MEHLREFVPGVYSHWKRGRLYIAKKELFEYDSDKKKILYSPINDPLKDATRDYDEFMSDSPDSEENLTGQVYRYEYVSDRYEVFRNRVKRPLTYDEKINISKMLNLGDKVIIELPHKEVVMGILDVMGTRTIKIRVAENIYRTITWINITAITRFIDTGL